MSLPKIPMKLKSVFFSSEHKCPILFVLYLYAMFLNKCHFFVIELYKMTLKWPNTVDLGAAVCVGFYTLHSYAILCCFPPTPL